MEFQRGMYEHNAAAATFSQSRDKHSSPPPARFLLETALLLLTTASQKMTNASRN